MTQPLPGDFFVTATYGSRLDRFLAWLIQWGTESPYNHAGVYLRDGKIMEAQPGGARVSDASNYPDAVWSTGHFALTDAERSKITQSAMLERGVGYGWLDIVAIAVCQKRFDRGQYRRHSWWAKRVSNMNYLICSQLVSRVYELAGVNLFTDGRVDGQVSPGDLGRLLEAPVPA